MFRVNDLTNGGVANGFRAAIRFIFGSFQRLQARQEAWR
jgi:hypothetical protein